MKKIGSLFLVGFCGFFTQAQVVSSANDITDQYVRFKEFVDNKESSFFRDLTWYESDSLDFLDSSPVSKEIANNLFVHPIKLDFYHNTTYVKSFNNGAVWSGKGLTNSVELGLSYKKGGIEITILPVFFSSQNQKVDTVGLQHSFDLNEYSYPWGNGQIDIPQQLGSGRFTDFNLGQSKIQYTFNNNLYLRVSNESMWWGPSYINPILMSNNAGGIPHFSFGSTENINSKIGDLNFKIYWGRLSESDFFDQDPNNNRRFFTGLNFSYEPKYVDGLSFGLSRTLQTNWQDDGLEFSDFVAFIKDPENQRGGGANTYDQLATGYVRWRYPSVGFETFFEIGRYDWGGDLKNFLVQDPEHTLVYTIGLAKTFDLPKGHLRFLTEFNTLSRSRLIQSRVAPKLYHHNITRQGYTQNGEIIGAASGPGSTNQYFRFDIFKSDFIYGVFLQRTTFNDDEFFAIESQLPFVDRAANGIDRDVEMSLGGSWYKNWNKTQLGVEMIVSVRDNYNFRDGANNIYSKLSFKRAF